MVTTRRSSKGDAVPHTGSPTKSQAKRGGDSTTSPKAKRSKKNDEKEQKTIEESMNLNAKEETAASADKPKEDTNGHAGDTKTQDQGDKNEAKDHNNAGHVKDGEKNAFDEVKADESEVKKAGVEEETKNTEEITDNKSSVVEDPEREAAIPSSILEKGIIYFFFRGRVMVDEPESVDDIARSYIVLRPLPLGAKLGEGPLEDAGNARLLALPKKVLPQSKRDRFMVFVEKPKASIKDLKDDFMAGSTYSTKTAGTRHTPPVTPLAEGVYAITSTGRDSHLVYHITVPDPLGEVQKDVGLNEKGSYAVSAKNPTVSAPGNVSLPKGADYPESIMKKFRGLRWMPLEPELLDYENTQFLIIGEGMGNIDTATEESAKDKKDDSKETPAEELEKLEDEDHDRVEHLKQDDPIFADLGLSSKNYPTMQTTW